MTTDFNCVFLVRDRDAVLEQKHRGEPCEIDAKALCLDTHEDWGKLVDLTRKGYDALLFSTTDGQVRFIVKRGRLAAAKEVAEGIRREIFLQMPGTEI